MGIGNTIKSLLKERGETLVTLSEKSGIPINTLYTITKRDVINVRKDTLQKLSTALEVPEIVILENNFNPSPIIKDNSDRLISLDNNEISIPEKHPDYIFLDKLEKISEKGFVEEFCKAYALSKEEVYEMLLGPRDITSESDYQHKIESLESLTKYSAINMIYSNQMRELTKLFKKLNYTGQREALKRIEELTQLTKYTRKE